MSILFRIFRVNHRFNNNLINFKPKFLSSLMSRTALLLLADGAEEMEVVITADVLRRGGVSICSEFCFLSSNDMNFNAKNRSK